MSAVSLQSILESGVGSGAGLLTSIGAAFYDIWVEAVVIALALHIYWRVSRSSSSAVSRRFDKAGKLPKACQSAAKVRGGDDICDDKLSRGNFDGETAEVRKLIMRLLEKESTSGPEALARYEHFVREQHVDMRNHITDDQAARSFYSALIECGVNAVAAPGGNNDDCQHSALSARATTSRLLADMRLFGFPRSHEFYSAVLKVHVSARLFGDTLWLYDVMVADGVLPDRTMYIYLLSSAVARGQDQTAIGFFKEICKTCQAPMRTYMTILRVYVKARDWQGAVELLEGLKHSGRAPDSLVLNTVLGLCVSEGKVAVAEGLLELWMCSADVVSCNIMFKGYAQLVSMSKSEKLLECMLRSGPAPNIISFNTIMDCAVRTLGQLHALAKPQRSRNGVEVDKPLGAATAQAVQRPWQLLDQLQELGLEPDRYTCSTLVKGLHLTGCSAQDIDRAVGLVRSVKGLHSPGVGCSGNSYGEGSNARLLEVLFNTLLDACVSIRDLDRMAEIFKFMGRLKVEVSAVTFSTLIKAFGQAGQLSHCHEVWQNMHDAKVSPTIVTFGCYIDMCVRNSDMEAAERVLKSMQHAGVTPNVVVYTSLIRGYAQARQPDRVLEVYEDMRRERVHATAGTFNMVLDILVRQQDGLAHVEKVVNDMRAASVSPDVATYTILIKASCHAGQVENAITFFRQLRSDGLAFDDVAFNTLLLACSNAGQVDIADEILGEMRAMGTAPTNVTISILVKMYGTAKMLDRAMEVSAMVEREYGIKPNLHVYTCLVQACIRNRQIRKSWDVFGRMLRAGVAPDSVTYGTMIHGCIYHNKFQQAVDLVRHACGVAPAKGCPLESLGLSVQGALKHTPVQLQQDVFKMLEGVLRRKSLSSLSAELAALPNSRMTTSVRARDPS